MAPTKTERELEYWKREIRRAIKAQEEFGHSADWDKWEKYYLGDYKSALSMNYTFALARTKTPQVYFRNPKIVPIARKPEKEAGARILDAIDDWVMQEMGLKSQMKLLVLDNFLYGAGILKLGYDSEYGFKPEDVAGIVETEEGAVDMSSATLTSRTEKMERLEYNVNIRPGMPWVLRVHPKEFLIDPAATEIAGAAWCAHRLMRRVSDAKADKKYSNTANLKPNYSQEYASVDESRMIRGDKYIGRNQDPDTARPQPDREDDWVELFEIRDARSQRVMVIGLKHNKFLVHDHDELQVDGLPFVDVVFNRNPKTFWGIPDAQVINPQQLELNEVRRLQQAYRRLHLKRFIMPEGALTDEEIEKLLGESDDPIIKVHESGGQDLDRVIKTIQGNIPPDLALWADNIVRDMRELVGLGRNQVGEFEPSSRTTATEAGIVQQNTQIRMNEGRDVLADALAITMRRVNQFMFKFWTAEQVIRVVGPDGLPHWVNYTGPELQGEYDYKIEPEDALPMDRERRRAEALALYQALSQNPVVNQIELAKYMLHQFEGANPEKLVQAQSAAPEAPMSVEEFGRVGQPGQPQAGPPAAPGAPNANL